MAALAGALEGCGGGGAARNGGVSGVLFDVNGDVVRGARVWVDLPGTNDPETASNSSGSYALEGLPEGVNLVRAEITQDGIRYYGQNMIQVFERERSKSTNITLVRESQLASMRGTVSDRFGNVLANAKVFAVAAALSGSYAITADDGSYSMGGLQAGVNYAVSASAAGYGNDEDVVNLAPGEQRIVNFALGNETNPSLPAPQNLTAVIWTSPKEMTRGREANAIEAVKRLADPRRVSRAGSTRLSQGGNWIEADLYWDELSSPQLLGYGIYRGTSPTGPLSPTDFLRDVYAIFYADLDDELIEGQTYYYEVSALNTSYPSGPGSESPPSNRYGVTALGDLTLLSPTFGPLTFRWNAANGAETYTVYVFDRYPGLGVSEIWQSPATASTSVVGPSLPPGTYYYVVLGVARGGDSRTISPLGTFVMN